MKYQVSDRVINFSRSSATCLLDRSNKRLLHNHPHVSNNNTTAAAASDSRKTRFGLKIDFLARGIRDHVRLAPKLTDSVKGKLSLGARILQLGGVEKVFKQLFNVREEEKLVKASQCYLSTTNGPIAGLLFISTQNIAFCSERSIKFVSPSGSLLRIYYKVSIPLMKIKRANRSQNMEKPTEKYLQVVTQDNFEFWFMGFLNLRKTLKCLDHQLIMTQSQFQSGSW